jgi:hypothetical protein
MTHEPLLREQTTARTLTYVDVDFLTKASFPAIINGLPEPETRKIRINMAWHSLMRGVQYIHKSGGFFPSMLKYDPAMIEPATPKAFGQFISPTSPYGSPKLSMREPSSDSPRGNDHYHGVSIGYMEAMEKRLRTRIDEKQAETTAQFQSTQKHMDTMMAMLRTIGSSTGGANMPGDGANAVGGLDMDLLSNPALVSRTMSGMPLGESADSPRRINFGDLEK